KNLASPATVLMQGLAIADASTAFCAYGFEILYQLKYLDNSFDESNTKLTMAYPYCALYVHVSLCEDLFVMVSTMLTLSLGIQKCLALKFPLWTRIYLTKRHST
ncbi:Hypothetical predicted protein, partial [Mytilus galloprovincialis]